ncbi:MAG: Carbon monoxide dehydrogenase medium chain [Syntrophorhabdus sp. PtaU1.Bin058]|nr:MAG: Carbon monoxide dehydrogenase medium chain [Syntrophorhabdus sp. PtaU1.Bin058]
MSNFEYHKPQTVKEAIGLMESLENAKYIAGGTDVMVLIRQGKLAPANLVSLRNITELNGIDIQNGVKMGAGATHTEIANNGFIRKRYSALADAAGNVGSKQIRNVATVGGNICNAAPSADTACPLLVFDAKVVIAGKSGSREVPIDDFFLGPNKAALGPGELVTGVVMPAFGENTGSAYIKHARRHAMDLPILGIAARVTVKVGGSEAGCRDAFGTSDMSQIIRGLEKEKVAFEDVRIAMSVVAPRPVRAKKAEEALKGKIISEKLFEEVGEIAASESQPRDSIRGEAWYRREMVKVLTRRALLRSINRIVGPETTDPDRLW